MRSQRLGDLVQVLGRLTRSQRLELPEHVERTRQPGQVLSVSGGRRRVVDQRAVSPRERDRGGGPWPITVFDDLDRLCHSPGYYARVWHRSPPIP